jgi:hypothetical protein
MKKYKYSFIGMFITIVVITLLFYLAGFNFDERGVHFFMYGFSLVCASLMSFFLIAMIRDDIETF